MDGRQLSNALYGLQSMKDETPNVAALLRSLTAQISAIQEPLEPRALSNGLYGLQNLSTRLPETRALLGALGRWATASFASGSDEDSSGSRGFSAQGLGMALYGLQGMRWKEEVPQVVEVHEVEELLTALLPYVEASPLDGQAVGNALYGLQSLSSDCPAVRRLLALLASKLKDSFDSSMTEQDSWAGTLS